MKDAYLVKFQLSVLIFISTHLESLLLMYPERSTQQQVRRGEPDTTKTSVL